MRNLNNVIYSGTNLQTMKDLVHYYQQLVEFFLLSYWCNLSLPSLELFITNSSCLHILEVIFVSQFCHSESVTVSCAVLMITHISFAVNEHIVNFEPIFMYF